MEDNQSNFSSTEEQKVGFPGASKKKKFKPLFLSIIVLLVLAGIAYGIYLFNNKENTFSIGVTPTVTQPVTSTPSPTPTPEPTVASNMKKSELKIQVLNGTGIAGEASLLKTKLTALGFTDVTAGNADAETYTT